MNGNSQSSERDLLESMVKERDEKMRSLEQIRAKQEMSLISLRSENNQMRIKQREASFFHRVEMEKNEHQNRSLEQRIHELERQLREENSEDRNSIFGMPTKITRQYVMQLQSQLSKSTKMIEVLDGQITLVKNSCDEIVKSFKEELEECLEDRCKTELDLLNQLSTLDNKKQIMEDEFRIKLQERYDDIQFLKANVEELQTEIEESQTRSAAAEVSTSQVENSSTCSASSLSPSDEGRRFSMERMEEELAEVGAAPQDQQNVNPHQQNLQVQLMSQLATLTREKDAMEADLKSELADRRTTVQRLQNQNRDRIETIESLETDMEVMRQQISQEYEEMMRVLMKDGREAKSGLEQISNIQTGMESSLRLVDSVFHKICPNELQLQSTPTTDPAISTIQKAALLHEEIKVSLSLLELKLKNQLDHQLSHDPNINRPSDQDASRKIQEDAIDASLRIQKYASQQYKYLQDNFQTDVSQLTMEMHAKNISIRALQETVQTLKQNTSSENPQEDPNQSVFVANLSLMKKLQEEVVCIVERVNEKNQIIYKLTTAVEEHKVREEVLRKELKRSKKRVKVMENDDALTMMEKSTFRAEF